MRSPGTWFLASEVDAFAQYIIIIEGRKVIGAMILDLPASGRDVTTQVNCLIPTITGLGQYFVKFNSLVRCMHV